MTAEEFCAITLLKDRRLRQIADAHFFPPPIESRWHTWSALTGFIRYQREKKDDTNEMKVKTEYEKHRKIKLANDEKAGLLTDTQTLAEQVQPTQAEIKKFLYAVLGDEAPTAMAGVDVPQARILGRRYADKICLKFKTMFSQWKL